LLTSFGTFWGAEGAGAGWPGGDVALLVLVPCVAAFALLLIAALRTQHAAPARPVTGTTERAA
ncbi:MAG: hypothetical protein ACRDTP_00355, partial [Mycobacteriales bacterium]